MLKDYFYIQLRQSVRVMVPLDHATEVLSLPSTAICPVPGVAPALLGVVNQRGRLLWVLDLSDVLGLAASLGRSQPQEQLTLLVLSLGAIHPTTRQTEYQLGGVVAGLKGIVSLDSAIFQPLPSQLPPAAHTFFSGMAVFEGAAIALLNVPAVLKAVQTFTPFPDLVTL